MILLGEIQRRNIESAFERANRAASSESDGNREAGSRQGVFRREGSIMKFYSLDDVSDGRLNYCETVINLRTESVEMTFYPF